MSKKSKPPRNWDEFASPERMNNLVGYYTADDVTLTPNERGARKILRKIAEDREAWHARLAIPRGVVVPDKPLPATEEELRDKFAAVTEGEAAVSQILLSPSRPPDGPECEALGRQMVDLRNRRWKLKIALREYCKDR